MFNREKSKDDKKKTDESKWKWNQDTTGGGSNQLSWPQVEQDPLCVLTVVTTLHQSQQQLGGVVLATRETTAAVKHLDWTQQRDHTWTLRLIHKPQVLICCLGSIVTFVGLLASVLIGSNTLLCFCKYKPTFFKRSSDTTTSITDIRIKRWSLEQIYPHSSVTTKIKKWSLKWDFYFVGLKVDKNISTETNAEYSFCITQ